MPKEGPSQKEWIHRLRLYASKEFTFSIGQHPAKGSYWGKQKARIDACGLFKSTSGTDLFGNPLSCSCSYHNVQGSSSGTTKCESSLSPPVVRKRFLHSSVRKVASPVQLTKEPSTTLSTSSIDSTPDQSLKQCTPPKEVNFSFGINFPVTPTSDPAVVESEIASNQCIGSPEAPCADEMSKINTSPSDHSSISPKKSPQCSQSPSKTRQAVDFSMRLPKGWSNIADADKIWIGRYVFVSKGVLSSPLRNWYHPPTVSTSAKKPSPSGYFLKNLFLWMPRKMWGFEFTCVSCHKPLRSRGLYQNVRLVLDLQSYYYIATEYMDCVCGNTYNGWDGRLLEQLPYATRCKFPASLTKKYAIDKSLLTMLRSRTLGNSPTALRNTLSELHSEYWLRRSMMYLQDCERHKTGIGSLITGNLSSYDPLPEFTEIPTAKWFLSTYAQDVMSRSDVLKGNVTSVFGRILKIDSTKKILKKLAGSVRGSASWVTNVGNEYGGILQCIVTTSEANENIQPMADGLVRRYELANVDPPVLIYTDRDCCNADGQSKIHLLFAAWIQLLVRLDVWHFMRRIAVGCSSESHPLYGVFMSQLSGCIFEWNKEEMDLLTAAKRQEIESAGLRNPSVEAVKSSLDVKEMARHCRRQTRGEDEVFSRIERLILEFTGATDLLGVPLFNENMVSIWKEQSKHVKCIQDPVDVALYCKTGTLLKGNTLLPVYRCARGSNSLESFHHHLLNFIPGTSANSVNFQAYLLDGLSRWNTSRKQAVDDEAQQSVRTFDHELASKFDSLHVKVFGKPLLCKDSPAANTDELIGVEFLFDQCKKAFDQAFIDDNLDDGIDSGIEVVEEEIEPTLPTQDVQEEVEPNEEILSDDTSVDSGGFQAGTKWTV